MIEQQKLVESIETKHREILEDLERLKQTDLDDAEFYADLQRRQAAIVRDLEQLKNNE